MRRVREEVQPDNEREGGDSQKGDRGFGQPQFNVLRWYVVGIAAGLDISEKPEDTRRK